MTPAKLENIIVGSMIAAFLGVYIFARIRIAARFLNRNVECILKGEICEEDIFNPNYRSPKCQSSKEA